MVNTGALQVGQLRMSLVLSGTALRAGHEVPADELEPGIALDKQAKTHSTFGVFADADLDLGLAVLPWLAPELNLPLRGNWQSTTFRDAAGNVLPGFVSIHHHDGAKLGIGDVGVGARMRLVAPAGPGSFRVDLRPGATLPTGGTVPNPDELGRAGQYHEHVFFGSGTLDPTLGLDADYLGDGWRIAAFASGRASLYHNSYGYQQGMRAAGGVGFEYTLSPAFRVMARPEIFHEQPSYWGSDRAEASGRTDIIAAAGATWLPAPDWFVSAFAKVPLKTWTAEGSLEIPLVATVTVTRLLRVFEPAP